MSIWCRAILLIGIMISAVPKLAAQTVLPEPITETNIDQLQLQVHFPWQARGQDMDVQWSPDGRTVAIATKLGAQTFDLSKPTDQPTMTYDKENWAKCVDYVPDRSVVVTCDTTTSTVWLWDRHTGEKLATLANGGRLIEYSRFSPNGKLLVVINGFENSIFIWGINEGNDVITPANARKITRLKRLDHAGYPSHMSFNSDGSLLASVTGKTVWIWDLVAFKVKEMKSYEASIYSVAFSPEGQWLALGMYVGDHYLIRLLNITDGNQMRDFSNEALDAPNDVNFSADGKLLVSAHNDGSVIIWSVGDGRAVHVIRNEDGLAWRAVFNKSGTLLATLNFNDGVRIWGIGDALALIPEPLLAINTQAVVTLASSGDVLNLRAEAGIKSPRLVQLKAGTVVTVIDGPQQADDLTWWKIRTANGAEGWVVESVNGEKTLTPDN